MYRCESWTIKKAEHWGLMVLNCGAGEEFWESLGQQGNQTCQSLRKPTLNIYWNDWCWSWIRIDAEYPLEATWCEKPTHWKRPWCWERLRAAGEGGRRGWDGWMALLTRWTWICANSRSCSASFIAQLVNHLPAIQETLVWSLGWEDPLEKGMETHSSILAWRIPWAEERDRLQSMGS